MNGTLAAVAGGEALALWGAWAALRAREAWLRSPFFPALFSLGAYLGCCAPFVALDALSGRVAWLRRRKLEARAAPAWREVWRCLARSLRDHLVGIFPATLAHWYWRPPRLPEAPPGLPRLLLDVAAGLLLFDALAFAWHLLHHRVAWLYRAVHKAHHRHAAPFALSTQQASLGELLSLGLLAALVPALLGCHPLSELAFFLANIWLSVEDHAGYDLPCSTHRLVPFGLYGGSAHHDRHHRHFDVNYAPYFTHWDRLFGTLAPVEEGPAPAKAARD